MSEEYAYENENNLNYDTINKKPRPIITYLILLVNIIIFVLTELSGGSTNNDVLTAFGAKDNVLIWSGEYWRLITPIFLHIGFTHLLLNSWALYAFGPTVEEMFGRIKFIFIYLLAGLTGVIMSVIMTPVLSAGASGAIFGLLGAMLYFSYHFRKIINRNFVTSLILMLGLNLFFGFSTPGIDNYAHLGGLVGGLMTASILGTKEIKLSITRKLFGLIWIAMVISLTLYTITPPPEWNFYQGNQAFKNKNYQQAEIYYRKVLKKYPKSIETHSNLGLTYLNQGKIDKALKEMETILEIDPNNQNALLIIERIKEDQ